MLGEQRAHGCENVLAIDLALTRAGSRPALDGVVFKIDLVSLDIGGVIHSRLPGREFLHMAFPKMRFASAPGVRVERF